MKHNIQNVPLLVEVTERYLVVSPFSTPLCESNFTCDQFCIYVDVLQAVLQIEIVRNDVSVGNMYSTEVGLLILNDWESLSKIQGLNTFFTEEFAGPQLLQCQLAQKVISFRSFLDFSQRILPENQSSATS